MDDKTMMSDGAKKGTGTEGGMRGGVLSANYAVHSVLGSLAMFPSGRICHVAREPYLDIPIPPFKRSKGR